MNNETAIALCRDMGWYVQEVIEYPEKPTGMYKFRWPAGAGFAYDYSAYINTNREPFADAVVRIAENYIAEDDRYRAGQSLRNSDVGTQMATERVRKAMDRTLGLMAILADDNTQPVIEEDRDGGHQEETDQEKVLTPKRGDSI